MIPIILITEEDITLEFIKSYSSPEITFAWQFENTLFMNISNAGNYVTINVSIFKITDLYEQHQLTELREYFVNPRLFLIQFTQFEQLRKLLLKFRDFKWIIDNDYGSFLQISDLDKVESYWEFTRFVK